MRFQGIVHITGEHDTGKTLMALGACHPSKTVFFHNDVKSPGIEPKEFGQYHDLVSKNLTYLQTKDYVLEVIDSLKPGEFEGIVFDTWTSIGDALVNYGRLHSNEFREKETMAAGGVFLYGQRYGVGRAYEASIISKLSTLAPYVCLTTHLKDHYEGGAKTGKQIPSCSATLDKVCNLRVWLRHNQDSGVPIALVLKRPSITNITKNGLEVIDYLPRRLCPTSKHKSVWDVIDRHKTDPNSFYDINEPTPYELSILDGILTDDQKEVWRANLQAAKEMEEFEAELENNEYDLFKAKVLEMKDQPLPQIYRTIKESFNGDYSLPEIAKVLNDS